MNKTSAQPFANIPTDQDFVRMGFFEENQLGVLMQEKVINDQAMLAFNSGPEIYSYLEGGGDVPVAMWSFTFPKSFGLIEVNFDLSRTNPVDRVALLNNEINQSVRFYLHMAGQMVDVVTLDLDPKSWVLFQGTLKRQQTATYHKEDYDRALEILYHYTSEEIMAMGQKFEVPRKHKVPYLRVIDESAC